MARAARTRQQPQAAAQRDWRETIGSASRQGPSVPGPGALTRRRGVLQCGGVGSSSPIAAATASRRHFLVDLPADVSGKAPVRQRRVGEAVELPAEPLAVERLRLVER